MEHGRAKAIADDLVAVLAPSCAAIEIAGSIRRNKAQVKDIEIVFVSKTMQEPVGFWETKTILCIDDAINGLVGAGRLRWDEQVKRRGLKYKRLVDVGSDVVVELFGAAHDNWGLVLALRTGPWQFNQRLVTQRVYGGAMPAGMRMQNGYLWQGDTQLRSETERVHFAHIGVPCWPPEQRTGHRLVRWLQAELGKGAE